MRLVKLPDSPCAGDDIEPSIAVQIGDFHISDESEIEVIILATCVKTPAPLLL